MKFLDTLSQKNLGLKEKNRFHRIRLNSDQEVAAAAEAQAQAPTGAPGRPPSQTPIPAVDVDALLDVLTAAVGDEQANTHVKKVVLPSKATAA